MSVLDPIEMGQCASFVTFVLTRKCVLVCLAWSVCAHVCVFRGVCVCQLPWAGSLHFLITL